MRQMVVYLMGMFLLAGCKKVETVVDKGTAEQTLLMSIGPYFTTLDPQLMTLASDMHVARALFEGLLSPDPKDLHPVPGVAESWEMSKDGLTYTFHLRPEARWSNGERLTAGDFVFSYKRILSAALGSESANFLYVIKNGAAYHKKEIEDFSAVGVRALDDHTLQFTLENRTPYFLTLILNPAWYPVHEKTLLQCGAIDQRDSSWTQVGRIITNGPFVLKSLKPDEKIILEKNLHYWGAKDVRLRKIHFLLIPDMNTEERAFRDHQLHITENVPFPQILKYVKKHSPHLKISPYLGTYCYVYNTTQAPLNDVRVRKALSMAINRRIIVGTDRVMCKYRAAYTFVPENTANYTNPKRIVEDIELAKKLLADAGYPNGQGFPKITLTFNTSESHRFNAEVIQEMWKKNLNIDVQLTNLECKDMFARRRQKQFQITRGPGIGDYNDATSFLNMWESRSVNNYSGWSNARYDECLRLASLTESSDERLKLLQEAETLLLNEMPLLILHSNNVTHLVDTSVKNWYPNILDWHPYQSIYLESSK